MSLRAANQEQPQHAAIPDWAHMYKVVRTPEQLHAAIGAFQEKAGYVLKGFDAVTQHHGRNAGLGLTVWLRIQNLCSELEGLLITNDLTAQFPTTYKQLQIVLREILHSELSRRHAPDTVHKELTRALRTDMAHHQHH